MGPGEHERRAGFRPASATHAALCAARGARRQDGAVRRLRDAGAVSRSASSRSTCTRARRPGLFDVSHMGQAFLIGPDHAATAAALEALVPADILNLSPASSATPSSSTTTGGIIDDLMVTRSASPPTMARLMLVVNASRKDVDYAHIAARLPAGVSSQPAPERALLALQGPAAADVMAKLSDAAARLAFMSAASGRVGEFDCHISRSGYTGEDGFEISVAAGRRGRALRATAAGAGRRAAHRPRRARLAAAGGRPVPLRPRHRRDHQPDRGGARLVDPEAPARRGRLSRRRAHPGRAGARPQAPRVGIKPDGRAPAREGTEILALRRRSHRHGHLGRLRAQRQRPVAMGYVAADYAEPGHAREPDGARQGAAGAVDRRRCRSSRTATPARR